jgi:hypothetical protein
MEIELKCTKGNAKLKGLRLGIKGDWEQPKLLTGKRRKWDSLHWSLFQAKDGDMLVSLQGLYRGSYGDAYCMASDLYKALIETGMEENAKRLQNACAANNVFF